MKLKLTLSLSLLLSLSPASFANDEYSILTNSVTDAPPVVEFFSFYCGPCYLFQSTYKVDKTVSDSLPKGVKLTKYHVSTMGKLGNELTEAWSIAMILNIEDKIENLIYDAQINKKINSKEDILKIFNSIGISNEIYYEMKESKEVKNLTSEQNKFIKLFNVTSTPSFYISGKYKINNQKVHHSNIQDYANNYASIINYLLKIK